MSGPDRTGLFLITILGLNLLAVLIWEGYALYWLEDGSAISKVIGRAFRAWPPLMMLISLVLLCLMWHFWEVGEP